MHLRLSGAKLDGHVTGGAGALFDATKRKVSHVSRQTVGGEIAVSTVEDDGDLDAWAQRQVVVEFGKGQRRAEIQIFAI